MAPVPSTAEPSTDERQRTRPRRAAAAGRDNAEDTAAFLAAVAEDGVVDDWGRRFVGRAAIAACDAAENISVHACCEGTGRRRPVSGGGLTGPSTVVFKTTGGRVRSVTIRG